jgi:uncharacterized OsmC-like protein
VVHDTKREGLEMSTVWCGVAAVLLVLAMTAGRAVAGEDAVDIRVEVAEAGGRVVAGHVRGHRLAVDQPVAWGGGDTAPTPPETYAFAVGACVVSTARLMAMLEGLDVGGIEAVVSGTIDFATALGKPGGGRAGYAGLELAVSLQSGMSREAQEAFLARVVARCPLCDTTARATPFAVTLARP